MTSRWFKRLATRVNAAAFPTPTIVTTILMAAAVAACSTPATNQSEPTVRVIARFRPAVLDPLDPAFLTRLAEVSRVTRIDPVRPMSGDAYVLQVSCSEPQAVPPSGDPCVSALARLRRSDAVLDLEVDRREKSQ